MTWSRRDESELDDAAALDTIRTFIAVQARDWQRRQLNRVAPRVRALIDEARSNGDAPDVPALIRQVWLDRSLPSAELEG